MSPLTKTRTPRSDEHSTPWDLFNRIGAEYGPFTLDAAAREWNAKCADYNDGVKPDIPWRGEMVWLNPPYSQLRHWMARAWRESRTARGVVCLVPVAPDCYWWSESVEGKAHTVRLLTRSVLPSGRVHFEQESGTKGRAPFASCLIIYRPPRVTTGRDCPRCTEHLFRRGDWLWCPDCDTEYDAESLRGGAADAPQNPSVAAPSLHEAVEAL